MPEIILNQYNNPNSHIQPVSCAFMISEDGEGVQKITPVYDSESNAENASCTGTPVMDLLAKLVTGTLFHIENTGTYTIDSTSCPSDNYHVAIQHLLSTINSASGWSAIATTQSNGVLVEVYYKPEIIK